MLRWTCWSVVAVLCLPAMTADAQQLVPFVLPWNDAAPEPFSQSPVRVTPLDESQRLVVGEGGHLFAGGQRTRLWGVNLCFGGNFPSEDDAPQVAARLAKFRVNAVRFHHMDSARYPRGILTARGRGSRELEPEALDRLHRLVFQLGQQHIYSDINLVVGRHFVAADGLPAEIDALAPKRQHLVGFFFEPLIELQKEYARKLLTAKNRHSGRTLAEEPSVAIVEINNENGLVHGWMAGDLDQLPAPFEADLRRRWNHWLRERYESDESLRKAWGSRNEPLGDQLLMNADFQRGTQSWNLEQHGSARAQVKIEPDEGAKFSAARIQVEQTSDENWHVQFQQPGLKVRAGQIYSVHLKARADRDTTIALRLSQAHAPWQGLGFERRLKLSPQWREFQFTLLPSADDDNARLGCPDLGQNTGTYWLAGISLRPGGRIGLADGETLKDGTVPLVTHSSDPPATRTARRDWIEFLRQVEHEYWTTMAKYLRDELHVKALVVGTITGTSPATVQAKLDAIDSHAYWQHPRFPGRPWDADNWVVVNESMVNSPPGTLGRLAAEHIAGKPHLVTEYNHPSPNTYSSEAPLLLAAYAALQDWDGVFLFAYSHRDNNWNTRAFTSFFDFDQHPLKMANASVAATLFRRGDVQPAREVVTVRRARQDELNALTDDGRAWRLVDAESFGIPGHRMLEHRIAWEISPDVPGQDASPSPRSAPNRSNSGSDDARRWQSDTGQLMWDATRAGKGVVTINSPRSKGVVGFVDGRAFELSGIRIAPDATRQDWCTLMVTKIGTGDLTQPGRALVVATGWAENTGMKWKSDARDSVGRNWGGAPSLIEVIPARIEFPFPRDRVSAWALDESGRRGEPLPVESLSPDRSQLQIGPPAKTVWYEIEVQ